MSEPSIPTTLADELQREITRVRDHVLPAYLKTKEMGLGNCDFAIMMIRKDLDDAVRALAEHNGLECLRLYKALKGTTT